MSIGQELVKLGFGTTQELQPTVISDKDFKIYANSLKMAQKWAERKRNGIWQFKYAPTLLWKVRNRLDERLKSMLPESLSRFLNI